VVKNALGGDASPGHFAKSEGPDSAEFFNFVKFPGGPFVDFFPVSGEVVLEVGGRGVDGLRYLLKDVLGGVGVLFPNVFNRVSVSGISGFSVVGNREGGVIRGGRRRGVSGTKGRDVSEEIFDFVVERFSVYLFIFEIFTHDLLRVQPFFDRLEVREVKGGADDVVVGTPVV